MIDLMVDDPLIPVIVHVATIAGSPDRRSSLERAIACPRITETCREAISSTAVAGTARATGIQTITDHRAEDPRAIRQL